MFYNGLPVTSFDYDLWVMPKYREKVFKLLLEEGFEPSSDLSERRPVVFFLKDIYKIDIFFAVGFGKINFKDAYARASVFKDKNIRLTVCAPEDIISLKSFRRDLCNKDKEDIEFLKRIKKIK